MKMRNAKDCLVQFLPEDSIKTTEPGDVKFLNQTFDTLYDSFIGVYDEEKEDYTALWGVYSVDQFPYDLAFYIYPYSSDVKLYDDDDYYDNTELNPYKDDYYEAEDCLSETEFLAK